MLREHTSMVVYAHVDVHVAHKSYFLVFVLPASKVRAPTPCLTQIGKKGAMFVVEQAQGADAMSLVTASIHHSFFSINHGALMKTPINSDIFVHFRVLILRV